MTRRAMPAVASLAVGLMAGGLTACNFAPPYQRPKSTVPAEFKETQTAALQGWKIAEPRDAAIRGPWWELYGDPVLNDLEAKVAISNQTVVAAEASYRAALALAREAEAQLFPTLTLAPSATRERSSTALQSSQSGATQTIATQTTATAPGAATSASRASAPFDVFSVPLELSYQIDLWGSIRNSVAENRATAQASAAQLANALLSTQSTLAEDYFQLRVADEQQRILDKTVGDYRASLNLVRALIQSGTNSEADQASAEAQLDSAEAQAIDVGIARAQYEHAIAVLVGVPPAGFSIPYQPLKQQLPDVPVAVPSDLLERRPDIAAAERQVAASNAQIGVARAAYFPTLSLSASGGFESTGVSHLFSTPNRVWSIGSSLAAPLFDGGERRAAVAQARALNDSQVATYRQTVLAAFQSVEDNLAALRILSTEVGQAHGATVAAQRALDLTLVLYRTGIDSYANVITAQTTFLAARETELGILLRQLVASVTLVNALGGGWQSGGASHGGRPVASAVVP